MTSSRFLPALVALLSAALPPNSQAQNYTVSGTTYTLNTGVMGGGGYQSITVNQYGTLTQNGGVIHGTGVTNTSIFLEGLGGLYNLNGGQLFGSYIYIGGSGYGFMNQTGGEAYLGSGMVIGGNNGNRGVYQQSGGLMDAPYVAVGGNTIDSPNSSMSLFGGTLATRTIFYVQAGSVILNLSGGTLKVTGNLTPEDHTNVERGIISSGFDVRVGSGGAIFDLNGYNTSVRSTLKHDTAAGATDGGLTIRGSGTLTIDSAPTYLGRTNLEGGTLRVASANLLAAHTVEFNGGRVEAQTGSAVGIGGLSGTGNSVIPTELYVGANHQNTTYSGALSGTGVLVKTGTGNLTLTGVNSQTGGTWVSSGTVTLAGTPADGVGIIRGALAITEATLVADAVNAFGWQTGAKVNRVEMSNGKLISNANNDQGWGIEYVLYGNNLLSSNGGVSSGTTASRFAFGGVSGTNTSVTVNSGSSIIAGRVDLRGDDGNTNVNFTTAANSHLNVSAAMTSTGGDTGFTKLGAGQMHLTGSSALAGEVNVNGGILRVRDGGSLTNASTINIATAGSASVFVTGSNSSWTGGNIFIGQQNSGSLTIENGAQMKNAVALIGRTSGTGAVTVTGTGSHWDNDYGMAVGENGRGTLVVSNGAQVTNAETRIGLYGTSSGSVRVTGAGSVWTSRLDMSLGAGGAGILTIANGGVVNVGSGTGVLLVAEHAGSAGTLNIGAEAGSAAAAAGTLNASRVQGLNGSTKLINFNHTNLLTFSPTIAGSMTVSHYSGTTRLSGANTYDGGTVVRGGVLQAAHSAALGSGQVVVEGGVFHLDTGVSIANSVILAGGEYRRTVNGSLAGAMTATSDFAGGRDTRAQILAGQTSTTRTLSTSFTSTAAATNDILRRSDVYHLDGTGADIFVLELSFTSTAEGTVLGWLNGNQWVNATDGNTGSTATAAMLEYNGTFAQFQAQYGTDLSSYIGAYGASVVGGTTTTWAVLNHNSAFAAIPEPASAFLAVTGTLILLTARRRRA